MKILLPLLLATAFSGTIYGRECVPVDAVTDLDINQLTGVWYTVTRSVTFFDLYLKCQTFYTSIVEPDVLYSSFSALTVANEQIVSYDILKFEKSGTVGEFGAINSLDEPEPVYKVKLIAVDYDDYAVWYTCDESLFIEIVTILSRDRIISDRRLKELSKIANDAGIGLDLSKVDQSSCDAASSTTMDNLNLRYII